MANLTLVIGGARAGKSAAAERLIAATGLPVSYIATATAGDDEMAARIAQHRAARDAGWATIETPIALAPALDAAAGRAVLIDCLTLWLSNLMLGGHDVAAAMENLLAALARRRDPTVVVANEVGLGIVPEHALARAFRDEAGRLNQRVAAQADRVLFIAAGLALTLK